LWWGALYVVVENDNDGLTRSRRGEWWGKTAKATTDLNAEAAEGAEGNLG
jgi:hypothetical protein